MKETRRQIEARVRQLLASVPEDRRREIAEACHAALIAAQVKAACMEYCRLGFLRVSNGKQIGEAGARYVKTEAGLRKKRFPKCAFPSASELDAECNVALLALVDAARDSRRVINNQEQRQ